MRHVARELAERHGLRPHARRRREAGGMLRQREPESVALRPCGHVAAPRVVRVRHPEGRRRRVAREEALANGWNASHDAEVAAERIAGLDAILEKVAVTVV